MTTTLLAAGSNAGGQLGIGHQEDAHIWQECQCDQSNFPPEGFLVVQLSSGSNHAVALVAGIDKKEADLQLWGSGIGKEGQLGKHIDEAMRFQRLDLDLGSIFKDREEEKENHWRPIRVACGWNSTFIVLQRADGTADDAIIVLGTDNDFGQLGLGEVRRIDQAWGVVQISTARQEEGPIRIKDIACGLRHAILQCQIGNRTQIIGWGAARHGQLDGQTLEKYPVTYWKPHLVDEWEVEASFQAEGYLAAGKEHTVYCGRGNTLRIIGSNRQGQQTVVSAVITKDVISAACTWNATLVLLKGLIVGSGNNSKGQLGGRIEQNGIIEAQLDQALQGKQSAIKQSSQLTCGSEHSMILVSRGDALGEVWGWGWNEHGNLAQDDVMDKQEPVCMWPLARYFPERQDKLATHIWAGCGTSFIQIQQPRQQC